MSGVAPVGPMQEYSPNRRQDELEQIDQASTQPPSDETSPQEVQGALKKQAEKTTVYAFQYTGLGSFIDKVF